MNTLTNMLDKASGLAFVLAGALAVAVVAYLVVDLLLRIANRRTASGRLEDFFAAHDAADVVEFGSARWKIRAAFAAYGVNAAGKEEVFFYLGTAVFAALAFAAASLIRLSPFLALPGGVAVGYMVMRSAVAGHWEKVRREMEAEVPTLMRNISGIIQATPSVVDALNAAGKSLDPRKPLHVWLEEFVGALQRHGRGAFKAEAARAYEISSALGVLVYEVERLWESGGQGYARAFKMTADNLGEVLLVRGQAQAKTGSALSTAKIIIAAAVVTLGYIISSPSGQRIYLDNAVVKVAMILAILWGIYGWSYIKAIVREAVE